MSDLRNILAKAAPVLGTAIGGPLGGAVVSILAQVFDTDPTEAAVTAAVNSSDPEVVKANLARAEAAFKAAAEESVTLRQQITSHVEMMRLDYDRGVFFSGWRPMGGWIAMVYAAAACFLTLYQAFHGHYELLNLAPQQLMVGGPIMAIAGIYALGKSQERVAMANNAGSGLGDVVKDLVSRVTK